LVFISWSRLSAGLFGYIALFELFTSWFVFVITSNNTLVLFSTILPILVICAHCLLTDGQMPYPIHAMQQAAHWYEEKCYKWPTPVIQGHSGTRDFVV
jgi:hypothetical protein